jgi:hypothetical protein
MWLLLLLPGLLQAAPDCEAGTVVRGQVWLHCKECRGRLMKGVMFRVETDRYVREVWTNREGWYEIRELPPGDYRLSMKNHKLVWAGAYSRIRVPEKGCVHADISFSAYGAPEQMEEVFDTARNYVLGAIDIVTGWFH